MLQEQAKNSRIHKYSLIGNQYRFVEWTKGEKKKRDFHTMQLGFSPPEVVERMNLFLKSRLEYRVGQGSADYGPWPKSSHDVFLQTVLLEQLHSVVRGCFCVL